MLSTKYLLLQPTLASAIGESLEFSSKIDHTNPNSITGLNDDLVIGSWSKETSLKLASLSSLAYGFSLNDLMLRYTNWLKFGDYTPFGKTFQVDDTIRSSINKFNHGVDPLKCGGDVNDNSGLIRITPIAFFLINKYQDKYAYNDEVAETIHSFTKVTHCNPLSSITAGIYINVVARLFIDPTKQSIKRGINEALNYYKTKPIFNPLTHCFEHLRDDAFFKLPYEQVNASDNAIDTLNAVFWCIFNSDKYLIAVKRAINFGDHTVITTLTSMIGSVLYSPVYFPHKWIEQLNGRSLINQIVHNALISNNF